MQRLAPHLSLADSVKICNVWILEHGDQRFLLDTSFRTDRWFLERELHRAGLRGKGDVTAILLTHRHSDHAANAAWLRDKFDAPVICHRSDAPILSGVAPPPRLFRGQGAFYQKFLCLIEDRWPSRCPIDEVYEDGAWKWGFRIIPTPGHTEGSVMLYHEPTRTLFSGDSIVAGPPPLRSIEWLHLAVPAFSNDVEACRGAVRSFLREMPPIDLLCSGHGPLVHKEVTRKLKELSNK